MSYQSELNSKLDSVRSATSGKKIDVNDADQLIIEELEEELDFDRYELNENDIVRALKLQSILKRYDVFNLDNALKMFYAIAKATCINVNSLFNIMNQDKNSFLNLIKELRFHDLIDTNEHNEVELTKNGRKFAKEIGIDIFL
jgi:predicted transcriptional regulator